MALLKIIGINYRYCMEFEVTEVWPAPNDELRILKYVGFEEAAWVIPEVKTGIETVPPAAGQVPAPSMEQLA